MATTGALFIRRLRAESLRNIDIAMDEDTNIEHESEPCSFYVAGVPAVVFDTDPETSIKPEFESIFKEYGEEVRFTYLKTFGRVRVTYPDPEQCRLAENNLSRQEFRGANLILKPVDAITIGTKNLEPPKREKTFLISPPASPPVGWEQSPEAAPVVNYSLFAALASLQQPGEVQEVHTATHSTPSIVVMTPDNEQEDLLTPSICREQERSPRIQMSALPRHMVQTHRPPLQQSQH